MMRLTAENIVKAIKALPRDVWFNYVNDRTTTKVRVVRVDSSEGPIIIERSSKGINKEASISSEMLWRIANAFLPNTPINFDRVLGASYNTRSALETLMAHTPEFFWCRPGRIELAFDTQKIKPGHKHLTWLPNTPHKNGVVCESPSSGLQAISELPLQSNVYDALVGFDDLKLSAENLPIEVKRRHLQIQIALIEIGNQIGFRTWVAHNDRGYRYGDKPIGELNGVIARLSNESVLLAYPDAIKAANLIDCIWFKNGKLMPAVMEVEHSTGILSGLTRMKQFQDCAPRLEGIRWVIVAPDEDRAKVLEKTNHVQFRALNTRFFPYSAVEELHYLCRRRGFSRDSVNEKLLDCFMESCIKG